MAGPNYAEAETLAWDLNIKSVQADPMSRANVAKSDAQRRGLSEELVLYNFLVRAAELRHL